MVLVDYLIAARWGRALGRLGLFARSLRADRLAQARRLALREAVEPGDARAGIDAASDFWCAVMLMSGVVLVVATGLVVVLSDHRHLIWASYLPTTVPLGGLVWAGVLYSYGMLRYTSLYDGVIAQRAGHWGNRVLARLAWPKQRDFWIATALGLVTMGLIQIALMSS